jgi:hypothetical protein
MCSRSDGGDNGSGSTVFLSDNGAVRGGETLITVGDLAHWSFVTRVTGRSEKRECLVWGLNIVVSVGVGSGCAIAVCDPAKTLQQCPITGVIVTVRIVNPVSNRGISEPMRLDSGQQQLCS